MEDERFYAYEGYKPELCEESLEHHGILGQKWRVKNGPPYPLSRSISTGSRLKKGASGSVKKKSSKGGLVARYKAKKVYKQKVQSAERARQAKQQKAEEARARQEAQDRAEREALEREQWRQDVMRKADIESARDHTDLFSTDEINQIINRYNASQRLNQLVDDANKTVDQMPTQQPVQNQQQKKEDTRSKSQKIGDAINKIHNITGPVATVAGDAQKIYSAYTSIFGQPNKNKNNTQNKAQDMAKIANSVQTLSKGATDAAQTFNKVNEIRKEKMESSKPQQNVQKPVENKPTAPTNVQKPNKSTDVNKKASDNLKAIQKENAKNTKVVDQVSNMISKPTNKPVSTNSSSNKVSDSYLNKQSTEVLQIMKDNIRDDLRNNTNKNYSNQQRATLQDIEQILKDRKRR